MAETKLGQQANYWWVNQGQTYQQERKAGILWAPKVQKNGIQPLHWQSMLEVRPGDVILHYAKGVRALSVVAAAAVDAHRPGDLPEDVWDRDGRMIRAAYGEAANAVTLDELPLDERLKEPQAGPFDRVGNVKQGYLFSLSKTFGEMFTAAFGDRFPGLAVASGSYVPSEARMEAVELLRALIGVPLLTVKGQTNKILAVRPPNVIVATESSPAGQQVPITWVENALQLLREHGSVTIHPDQIGYRSAFIGAVLLQLPYAQSTGSPPVISFGAGTAAESDASPQSPTDKVAADPFTGSLEKPFAGTQRGEQPALRRRLLGSMAEAECAICGETYPARFLWAAHIKPRSVCTDTERRDLTHVGMLACVFGCDALFEAGYISINENGHIVTSASEPEHKAIANKLANLEGRPVSAHTKASAAYFAWHQANLFRG
ncbi:HNH endonuclease signature motif containing protein [Micromonospora profundi]|uniref:HNH endonuclease signature motif containing protein n=1 Tax=Micromonospora profundi TaxID=1420889 RepID=A0AAJ6HS24_9ACTN|nr:HNH endonuclease signature motif containing protein [Micromonospora profundi]WLS43264.1 HNH endonuclease signature motif containing protein [Micromonospora profundi]